MSYVPNESNLLSALVYDLTMGQTGATPVDLQPTLALLRTADQVSHMLLVRPDADFARVGRLMRELRQTGLEVLLVGGSSEDRRAAYRVRPKFTGRGIRLLHLSDDGSLWAEGVGLGGYHGPLARYLQRGGRGSATQDWDAFGQRAQEGAARLAQETTSFAKLLASRPPVATWALVAAIGAVFALQLAFHATEDTNALVRMGALLARRVHAGELWRLVSCTFLHAGVVHVALNVLVLLAIGLGLERILGSARYLLVYVVSALGGSVLSLLVTKAVSVGASGALWGLMAAQFVLAWRSKNVLPQHMQAAVLRSAAQNLGLNLVNSFRPGVDWAAHIGGGLSGGLLMLALVASLPRMVAAPDAPLTEPRPSWTLRLLAAVGVVVLATGLGLGLARGQFWKLGEPPRFQRVALGDIGLTVEVPTELQLAQTDTFDPAKPEFVFGDLLQDPAVLDIIVVPVPLDPSDFDASYAEMKKAMDQAALPEGAKQQGTTEERRVGKHRILERRYAYDNGVSASSLVEIGPQGFYRVDFIRRASLQTAWQDVGEHALFSLERAR